MKPLLTSALLPSELKFSSLDSPAHYAMCCGNSEQNQESVVLGRFLDLRPVKTTFSQTTEWLIGAMGFRTLVLL